MGYGCHMLLVCAMQHVAVNSAVNHLLVLNVFDIILQALAQLTPPLVQLLVDWHACEEANLVPGR